MLITVQSSVRHNLSSSRAFKKVERGPDEKGKGALWSVDPQFEHTFEEQEARKQAEARGLGKKGKMPLEPPLKRSVKGDVKGPLPPPLTSAPLVMKTSFSHTVNTGHPPQSATFSRVEAPSAPAPPPPVSVPPTFQPPPPTPVPALNTSVSPGPPQVSAPVSSQAPSSIPPIPPSVRLPIVIGPVPSSSPEAANPEPKPIVLHQNTLILNPTIFSHLTPQHLRDLEALGAQKALEILQGYIVRFYKEKLRAEGGRGRGRGRGRRPRGGGSQGPPRPTAPEGLFVNTPLPQRSDSVKPEPQTNAAGAPPMGSLQPPDESPDSPVIIIDDDDEEDARVSKRPRLEGEGS